MSEPSERAEFPPALVVVIDTSVLIDLKAAVPIAEQWPLLEMMSLLVDAGAIAYPSQVRRELMTIQFPDTPGAWAAAHKGHARHREPREDALAEVLGAAPSLLDVNSEEDSADAYVIAMAWEIQERHSGRCRTVVATNDFVDRMPLRESVATACERLEIAWWRADAFFEWVRSQQ